MDLLQRTPDLISQTDPRHWNLSLAHLDQGFLPLAQPEVVFSRIIGGGLGTPTAGGSSRVSPQPSSTPGSLSLIPRSPGMSFFPSISGSLGPVKAGDKHNHTEAAVENSSAPSILIFLKPGFISLCPRSLLSRFMIQLFWFLPASVGIILLLRILQWGFF